MRNPFSKKPIAPHSRPTPLIPVGSKTSHALASAVAVALAVYAVPRRHDLLDVPEAYCNSPSRLRRRMAGYSASPRSLSQTPGITGIFLLELSGFQGSCGTGRGA